MEFNFKDQPGLRAWERPLVTDAEPLISIVTAFYNAGKYFEQTYRCVVNQTFPWFEWIIVDDGSSDEKSLALLERLALTDRRIKVLHQENSGPSAARNRGIAAAEAEYVYILDADDLEEPTSLEYHYWALRQNPKASWSFTASLGFGEKEYLWDVPYDPNGMKETNTLSVSALIRKKDAVRVGCYTVKEEAFDEDWHFWLKLIADGKFCVQMREEYLHWYRILSSGRMASIHGDDKKVRRNEEIISDLAGFVINPKKPVVYPSVSCRHFEELHTANWDRSVYSKHKKIHVLFLFPWLVMGGADKFNLDLLSGLDKDRYEITIATTRKSDNEWIRRFRKITPDIFNLPNFLDPVNYGEFIDYLIRSREIDLIFQSNSTEGYYLLPWIRKNHPNVAIVDYVHMEEWYWRNGGHARTSGAMNRIVEKTYVCNSATRDVMLQHFHCDPKKVETVHIGIDEKKFDPSRVRSGLLYEELKISKDRPVVLFLCRLHPQKRPFLMLKIAQYVQRQLPEAAFVVIGDGPQREELMDKSNAMGLGDTVFFAGSRQEVRPYYKDAKVTLICSMKEGLALTAYESLSMGVPVVSADVGGQRDLIDESVGELIPLMQEEEDDFDTRVFPAAEIKAYGEAILSMISDGARWQELSESCRTKIQSGFTIETMVRYFNDELEKIAADRNLRQERQAVSDALNLLGNFAEESYLLNLASGLPDEPKDRYDNAGTNRMDAVLERLSECENVLARHEEVVNRHEEVVNRHEEVVNRHEEVVNRHEEVVNRHEQSINHQWENQKWHEERICRLEKKR